MTEQIRALRVILEKSSDTDLVREMAGFASHRLMEPWAERRAGVPHGQRRGDPSTGATPIATAF
jgi:putative transposase